MPLSKWTELLTELSVYGNSEDIQRLDQGDFDAFESQNNVRLPQDYKYFCQVFGTCKLGDFIFVYCPTKYLVYSQEDIDGMIEQIFMFSSTDNSQRDENYIQLLQSSFKFADDGIGAIIFWDLRTYSEVDDSYDIYWAGWEIPESEDPVLIGRDFYEFVKEFCLGQKSYKVLPDPEISCPTEIPMSIEWFKPGY